VVQHPLPFWRPWEEENGQKCSLVEGEETLWAWLLFRMRKIVSRIGNGKNFLVFCHILNSVFHGF